MRGGGGGGGGGGVLNHAFSSVLLQLYVPFFIVTTLVANWISRSYLIGVAAAHVDYIWRHVSLLLCRERIEKCLYNTRHLKRFSSKN